MRIGSLGAHPVTAENFGRRCGGGVLIERPFADVAVDVVEAPGVRFLAADLRVLEVGGVVEVPGVLLQLACVVAKEVSGRGPGPGSVFPFGLGGQAVKVAGLGAEPLAVLVRGVLCHADGRVALAAHAEVHRLVGRGGL